MVLKYEDKMLQSQLGIGAPLVCLKDGKSIISYVKHNNLMFNSLDVIKHQGWETPTSIQAQAIPAIMSGRDVIGIAKTGSGKTVAFLLPMLRHVRDQRPVSGSEGPIAVVMSPTRELATQIYKECQPFLKVLNIRVSPSLPNQSCWAEFFIGFLLRRRFIH